MLVQMDAILRQTFLSSNVMRLRDFIKHVYVDRRYSGDKNFDKPPRVKPVRCPKFFFANFSKMYLKLKAVMNSEVQ